MNKPLFIESFKFSTKVLLTAVLVSPIILVIITSLKGEINSGWIYFVSLMIIYGGIFSVPCWLALMIAGYTISRTGWPALTQKSALLLWVNLMTIGIYLCFFDADSIFEGNLPRLPLAYWVVVCIGICTYRLPGSKKPTEKITTNDLLDEF